MANELALETLYFDTAEGIRLHAKACGPARAPVLLFVHGFPEFWYTWPATRGVFSRFPLRRDRSAGFQPVLAAGGCQRLQTHLLVADLRGVIQALGAPVFAVIAHDWGGAVAWSLAAQHPEMMQNFVVLNAPHTINFAKALASDPGQQAAGAYMNVLRQPSRSGFWPKTGLRGLRELLGELSDKELGLPRVLGARSDRRMQLLPRLSAAPRHAGCARPDGGRGGPA